MLALLLPATAGAQATSPEELAFWEAVAQGNRPAEYRAYLDTYPNGRFAPLALLRLQGGAPPAPTPAPAVGNTPAAAPAQVALRLTRPSVRATDVVTLDLDATALSTSSNLRLIVVPADAADAVPDPQRFAEEATPVHAARMRLSVPAGPPGRDEVRLYHIPRFATDYVVAGRAPVTVAQGAPGAVLARDLVREAAQLGPVRFEANHRDRPMLVQAAFLRLRPRTEWNEAWFGGRPVGSLSEQLVMLSLGLPNVAADFYGSRGEVVCVLPADNQAALDRVAGLQIGDPILVSGVPSTWSSAGASDPVLLDRCVLRP